MSDHYYAQHAYAPTQGDSVYYAPNHDQGNHHASKYKNVQYNAASEQSQMYLARPTVVGTPQPDPQDRYRDQQLAVSAPDPYRNDWGHDENMLSPHYEPRARRGEAAEYYEASHRDHQRRRRSHSRHSRPRESSTSLSRGRDHSGHRETGEGESERGLGGALAGGAAGYYLGHKKSHGLLGTIGGAVLGHFLEKTVDEMRDNRHDGHSSSSSSHHGSHSHGHGHHGRRRTRHHRHHSTRSRSSHSRRTSESWSD
ncbi:uncharacterized protein BDV17DRAFT_13154 [Aspergillus undulatus]|uniref:uncharacterized protein n=1 Tax=Aspergillus undulatus TaxID=1810928 RepID=UPI003CCD20ED